MESKRRRVSVFREVGLLDDEPSLPPQDFDLQFGCQDHKPHHCCRPPSVERIMEEDDDEASWSDMDSNLSSDEEVNEEAFDKLPLVKPNSSIRMSQNLLGRHGIILGLALILLHLTSSSGLSSTILPLASGTKMNIKWMNQPISPFRKRANSPTDVCKRWSQQSAIINGTLYLYGGRATTSSSQDSNTWNNYFITLDLTTSWQISAPPLTGLPNPSGPPAVANGYLWHSYNSVFLYGGEYSDTPPATPNTFSLWEYNAKSSSWVQHSNPTTSDGSNSEPQGEAVQGAAEGAGFSVPALGLGWYFGGHLDAFTSPSWSIQTPRLYLKSFIEYTYPGYSNPGVNSLNNGQTAGTDGAWRNITNAGIQDQSGFTERADGLLLYIPGFGDSGILLSLAGGTNVTFTQMNEVDVYDIANSTWYRQATSGPTPEIRVNPCAVVAAAADGSSYQIHMYGGQNLIPYGQQIQYSDMWILSIPSFTWIQVNTSSQSTPYARAGHTCDIWDSQMVVVGGYIGQNISCETPGIYVFNTSSLQWVNTFTALPGGGSTPSNPFSQQLSQRGSSKGSGLQGSYGYAVPKAVYDVIGGAATGGATMTTPAVEATAGPLATGKPITWTVTGPGGSIITETGTAPGGSGSHDSGTNVGAAVAGSVAGVLFVVALYAAFCALLYRKQLAIYRRHMALASADTDGSYMHSAPESTGGRWKWLLAGAGGYYQPGKSSTEGSGRYSGGTHRSSGNGSGNDVNNAVTGHRSHDLPAGNGYSQGVLGTPHGSRDDLLDGFEPSYWGVLLHPRRSLRVINR